MNHSPRNDPNWLRAAVQDSLERYARARLEGRLLFTYDGVPLTWRPLGDDWADSLPLTTEADAWGM